MKIFSMSQDSSDEIHKQIYEFMKANPDCMMGCNEEGVARVKREKN